MKVDALTLTPIGEPPTPRARWCPSCAQWYPFVGGRRRCAVCGTAVIRPMVHQPKPKPGELRPGIIAEFADPRDRYDPSRELAELRTRLAAKGLGVYR